MMITGQYDCLVLTREHDCAVSFVSYNLICGAVYFPLASSPYRISPILIFYRNRYIARLTHQAAYRISLLPCG